MKLQLEKPFEYLKRKDGSPFSPETIRHWYEARAYVLDKLKEVSIGPDSANHLEIVVTSDSPLMLSIVRALALTAHFPNFDDEKDGNRTVITIVSHDRQVFDKLVKEEYLGNLPYHCHCSVFGVRSDQGDTFSDIELTVVEEWNQDDADGALVISEEEVQKFLASKSQEAVYSIDTSKAVIADRIYSVGTLIDNLPAEDIHSPSRYAMALDAFQYRLLDKNTNPLVNPKKWENDPISVKNGLSNVFCADCFDLRMEYLSEKHIEAYSRSEHARWLTEKLIMGFRPLNKLERIRDERMFGANKNNYRKQLKKNPSDPVHVDICTYRDLRRIDPDSMKYDTFLMLAIPLIQYSIR